MTAMTTMTVEDYLALDAERHRHAELVDGMLIEVTPPHGRHQLMAVEVLSPDSGLRDLFDKREEYAAAGLERYLVAAPDAAAPALLYYERQGGVFVERAYVVGRNRLTLPEPFDPLAAFSPVDLVRLG